jgi:hypothetical protein
VFSCFLFGAILLVSPFAGAYFAPKNAPTIVGMPILIGIAVFLAVLLPIALVRVMQPTFLPSYLSEIERVTKLSVTNCSLMVLALYAALVVWQLALGFRRGLWPELNLHPLYF